MLDSHHGERQGLLGGSLVLALDEWENENVKNRLDVQVARLIVRSAREL